MKQHVIVIFDIGKTNKKYFLFDEKYNELESHCIQIPEITDDDNDPCDDLEAITQWMHSIVASLQSKDNYHIRYINCSAYGATLVHLDRNGKPCTPLYNYLKAFPEVTKKLFEKKHGDIRQWSKQTASPWLGMLNTGLQLFWIKNQKPHLFPQIHQTVFLPQYLSHVFTGIAHTEFTGVGCHTGLWDFTRNDYHKWVYAEGLTQLLPAIVPSNTKELSSDGKVTVGVGIHDSSAALIPYLRKSKEPFMLLSTGTWSICLNPFNDKPLTQEELDADCLCFMQPDGKQVKASRYFLGNIFTRCEKMIARYFGKTSEYRHVVTSDTQWHEETGSNIFIDPINGNLILAESDLAGFASHEAAYHQLIKELTKVQVHKIQLVQNDKHINRLYIDGGFTKNKVFLDMLQHQLPGIEIIVSDLALGSSLGAAMAVS